MKVQKLNEEQILNEAPWTKGTAARAFKKSEKDEKKRKAHDIKVLAKDFSKEWEKAQFYLPKFPKETGNKTIDGLNRSKPFTQEQWKEIFRKVVLEKDRSSPVFNLWHDATVLSPAGRILRRAGEDMTDAITYLTSGKIKTDGFDKYVGESIFGNPKYKYKYCYGSYTTSADAKKDLAEVRKIFKDAYIVRFKGLEIVKQEEQLMNSEMKKTNQISLALLEFRNAVQTSRLILESALKRKESRGLHYILDYPNQEKKPKHYSIYL